MHRSLVSTQTPGPWHSDRRDILTADVRCIATVNSGACASQEEADANACLIAAAPDLLGALLALRAASGGTFAGWHDMYRPACTLIEAALAAVEGK